MNLSNNTNDPQTSFTEDLSTNALFEQLRRFFRAPVFEDDKGKNRKARIVNATLLTLLPAAIALEAGILLTNEDTGFITIFPIIIQVALVIGLIALRRGRVEETAIAITSLLWLIISVQSILFGTVFNPMIPNLVIIVYLSGVIISNRAAVLYAALSALTIGATIAVEQFEMLSQIFISTTLNYSVQIGISYFLMAGLVILTNRYAKENAAELDATQRTLTESEVTRLELETYLSQTVEENTLQLERRNKYLEAASLVAQRSISTLDLQEMLDTIAAEISKQLDFYHTGIFLVDEHREWAVMRAASSEGGKRMIARNHRLAVGKQGMVGFVTSIGQPRITQDIELDRIHSVAPELPDTRAEMTLPLKTRDQIIGAIDIQDTNPNAFTNEDLAVLQTMADQIALAVENIRLFNQAQESLEEIQRVYGEFSQQAWAETYRKNLLHSYHYAGGSVTKLDENATPEINGNKIAIPVNIRGVTIGEIEMAKEDETQRWSNEEIKLLQTISEQLGVALDSARLFGESQLRANSEQVITEVSSQLWETMDINTILKNTAQNLRASLDLPELTIRMSPSLAEQSQNGDAHPQEPVEKN